MKAVLGELGKRRQSPDGLGKNGHSSSELRAAPGELGARGQSLSELEKSKWSPGKRSLKAIVVEDTAGPTIVRSEKSYLNPIPPRDRTPPCVPSHPR